MGLFFKKKAEAAPAKTCDSLVKILGSGCAKCNLLEENTKEALKQLGITMPVSHVHDYAEIASYGVMGTPALVYDREVLSVGTVLKPEKIAALLRPFLT